MKKQLITVGMDNAIFQGKVCEVRKVSRGWFGIIDHSGRAKTVRASEVTVAGDTAKVEAKPALTADSIAEIQHQTESNTMATTQTAGRKRGGTRVRVARATRPSKTFAKGTRKVGDSPFKRFDTYVKHKTPAGNVAYDNGDNVAAKLRDMTLAEVFEHAAKKLDVSERSLKDKYSHLNDGMKKMNLANRLRGLERAKAKAKA